MKLVLAINEKNYRVEINEKYDLSIGISQTNSPQCFYAAKPTIQPFVSGDFVGSTKSGSPVNFFNVSFNPHGNGTHTECRGHITKEFQKINSVELPTWMIASLISVGTTKQENNDQVISQEEIEQADIAPGAKALIIRTQTDNEINQAVNYSGTNPPYLSDGAMKSIVDKGIEHLLIDLPSVDKEQDGGALKNHKTFWGINGQSRPHSTITELIKIGREIADGMYLLNLQVANFDLDCAPSRPILHSLVEIN